MLIEIVNPQQYQMEIGAIRQCLDYIETTCAAQPEYAMVDLEIEEGLLNGQQTGVIWFYGRLALNPTAVRWVQKAPGAKVEFFS